MIAKLYYPNKSSNKLSLKKVKDLLHTRNIEYVEQSVDKEHLKWEQLVEMLSCTQDGVSDIIAANSKIYKTLISQGVDFDNMSLSELLEYFHRYPKLIKSPILVYKGMTIGGYGEEEMSVLKDRSERRKSFVKC